MNKKSRTNKQQKEKFYVMSAFSLLLTLFGLYIYFVSVSVLHVVMQQEMSRQVSALSAEVSTLEAQYIRAQHDMSNNIASLQGYVEASNKVFIHRGEDTLVLSSTE